MIKRHKNYIDDSEIYIEFLDRKIDKKIKNKFKETLLGYRLVESFISEYIDAVAFADYNKLENPFQYLFYGHQMARMSFKMSLYRHQKVKVQLADKEIVSVGDGRYFTVREWLHTFDISVLLDDKQTLDELCAMSTYEIKRRSDDEAEDVLYALVELRKRLWQGIPLDEAFQERMANVEKTTLQEWGNFDGDLQYRLDGFRAICFNQIPVLASLFEGNENLFNKELEKALLVHKNYFAKEEPTDRGLLPLYMLCACALAKDRGLKVTVESEYIPKWIYERDFKEGYQLLGYREANETILTEEAKAYREEYLEIAMNAAMEIKEMIAEAFLQKYFPESKNISIRTGSESDFDLVFFDQEEKLHLITIYAQEEFPTELDSRICQTGYAEGKRVSEGTRAYLEDVFAWQKQYIDRKHDGEEKQMLLQSWERIHQAYAASNFDYLLFYQNITPENTLGKLEIRKFDL